jgi:hypothetical protein
MNTNVNSIIESTAVDINPTVTTLANVLPEASDDEDENNANCDPSDEAKIPIWKDMILRNPTRVKSNGKTGGITLKQAKLVARSLGLAFSRSNKIKTIDCFEESEKNKYEMTLAVCLEESEQLSQEPPSYRKDNHTLPRILNIMFQSGNNLQLMMSTREKLQAGSTNETLPIIVEATRNSIMNGLA